MTGASGHIVETTNNRKRYWTTFRLQSDPNDGRWREFEKSAEGAIMSKLRKIQKSTKYATVSGFFKLSQSKKTQSIGRRSRRSKSKSIIERRLANLAWKSKIDACRPCKCTKNCFQMSIFGPNSAILNESTARLQPRKFRKSRVY